MADHHAYKAERRLDNERLAAGRKDGYAADFCERAQKFLPAVVTGRSRIRPPSGVVLPDAFGAEKTAERGGRRGEARGGEICGNHAGTKPGTTEKAGKYVGTTPE